jgi:hypothetical protein
MKQKQITVGAARIQQDVLDGQCDVWMDGFDTVADAKQYARRVLTDEYQRSAEMSAPLGYSQVCVDGECIADYFRKA